MRRFIRLIRTWLRAGTPVAHAHAPGSPGLTGWSLQFTSFGGQPTLHMTCTRTGRRRKLLLTGGTGPYGFCVN
jgi:hypothetical protein